MRAAATPIQRPLGAKILAIDGAGTITHWARADFLQLLRPGDLVIANDAATLPASLTGRHMSSGEAIEVRLAGRRSLVPDEIREFAAVVFGDGDYRIRTEDRRMPPTITQGDRLALGSLRATVTGLLKHPRFVSLTFDGTPAEILEGLAREGHAIQYSHLPEPLALWDVWTSIASLPVAFESPSAGFILDWAMLTSMREHRIAFVTITHAAGISSTGDSALDSLLPLDEAYRIPQAAVNAITQTRLRGGRLIAVGTTVVRALEHSARLDGAIHAGDNLATQKITPSSPVRVVDAILSGTHEPGTSHYDLLGAFVDAEILCRADEELAARDYRTHEFGDSMFVERGKRLPRNERRSAAA